MKTEFCSFCRTRQEALYGLTSAPDAYCICANCINEFNQKPPKKTSEGCCFCAETGRKGYEEKSSGAVICVQCLVKYLEQTRATPVPVSPSGENFEVKIQWPMYLDSLMDLIEVRIEFTNGEVLSANFTTPGRIPWEMDKGRRNGQWAGGIYFWHDNLVFVDELTDENIQKAVKDLSKNGLLKKAFHPL